LDLSGGVGDLPGPVLTSPVPRRKGPAASDTKDAEPRPRRPHEELGAEAGRILAGASGGYDAVSSFFTEVFGDTTDFHGEGSLAGSDLVISYEKRGRLVGALTVGQSPEVEADLRDRITEGALAVF
jgi:hypothetical protein